MTTVEPAAIAAQARKHLGETCPVDSCVSNGLERWTHELGLPGLGTASVNEARARAKAGHNGWRYVAGTGGLKVGYFVDWDPDVLGDPDDRHVSCVDELNRFGIKSIGSGGPSGKVAYQPQSGGFNPAAYFVGYFVPPTHKPDPTPAPKPAAAAPAVKPAATSSSSSTYTVQRGDDLTRIAAAHHTTVAKIMAANPPAADHTTKDYSIIRSSLILAGQKIRLP